MNKQIETILEPLLGDYKMEDQIIPARQRVRIGSCVDIRPQQYARKDPYPQMPFAHEMIAPPSKWEVAAYLAVVVACYIALVYLGLGVVG